MLLTLENVRARIEGVPVLREVDLSVGTAESVAIVGRNGAGKTSTFRTVMGLRDLDQGTVTFSGENITDSSTPNRKRLGIGFAPEDRQLISKLTARENIEMSLWGSDDELEVDFDERLEMALEIFPMMSEFLDRAAGKLSGGQQQMVAVSRALVSKPDLVLLDEPFEGLAPSIKKDLRKSISIIRNELGASLFIAESQLSHVKGVVDRLYVIERGEIIAEIDDPATVESNDELMRMVSGG
ncbi:ABC transporter ATP-binding protein [Haloglomus irregulare]|jgi:branched-chain amino acid transport system ATP-binding protein|uniref:ABC transporter ATP-binding protein n=1 Tax=Haloglomus irregulare TaxID=2234134 RepID=A0A554MU10_9EURY|nr:ATP-binding cassette domain-containing protein [Haloglomus irregulare]TSD08616.1 ABC transporter ATP-binding protein [Haloglomus irregulare]